MNRARINLFKFKMEETEPPWRGLIKMGDFPGNTPTPGQAGAGTGVMLMMEWDLDFSLLLPSPL